MTSQQATIVSYDKFYQGDERTGSNFLHIVAMQGMLLSSSFVDSSKYPNSSEIRVLPYPSFLLSRQGVLLRFTI